MLESKEKKKKAVMGVIIILFVITAYVTFFKDKTPSQKPSPPSAGQEIQTPGVLKPGPVREPTIAVPATPLEPEAARAFLGDIRDIFQKPPSPEAASSQKKPSAREEALSDPKRDVIKKALSDSERDVIKKALKFKGAILHGSRSVAAINASFFHIGDLIDGYTVVSISEKQVEIESTQGRITLEILNYD